MEKMLKAFGSPTETKKNLNNNSNKTIADNFYWYFSLKNNIKQEKNKTFENLKNHHLHEDEDEAAEALQFMIKSNGEDTEYITSLTAYCLFNAIVKQPDNYAIQLPKTTMVLFDIVHNATITEKLLEFFEELIPGLKFLCHYDLPDLMVDEEDADLLYFAKRYTIHPICNYDNENPLYDLEKSIERKKHNTDDDTEEKNNFNSNINNNNNKCNRVANDSHFNKLRDESIDFHYEKVQYSMFKQYQGALLGIDLKLVSKSLVNLNNKNSHHNKMEHNNNNSSGEDEKNESYAKHKKSQVVDNATKTTTNIDNNNNSDNDYDYNTYYNDNDDKNDRDENEYDISELVRPLDERLKTFVGNNISIVEAKENIHYMFQHFYNPQLNRSFDNNNDNGNNNDSEHENYNELDEIEEEEEDEDYNDDNNELLNGTMQKNTRRVQNTEKLDCEYIDAKVKIVDLGNACWTHKHFTEDIQTRQYRAPEVIIGAGYDTSADMWSLACIVFELLTGDLMFDPHAGKSWSREEDHLALIIELTTAFPRKFLNSGKQSWEYFTKNHCELKHIHQLNYWGLKDVLHEKYKFSIDDAIDISEFLEKLIEVSYYYFFFVVITIIIINIIIIYQYSFIIFITLLKLLLSD
jgi:hypothetical protein